MITTYSRKTNIILYSFFLFFLIISSLLILLAPDLILIIQNILETKVFHRSFSLEKWSSTLISLLVFPIFFVIFLDAILFPKYSDTFKIVHIITFLLVLIFLLSIAAWTKSAAFMNSDMASELLLAKECFLNKTFFPTSWYYSTELRVLNTQIISAPLFLFTNNLKVIKLLTVVICTLFLPLSMYYLLKSLKIQIKWLVWLGCLLITIPFSITMWNFVQLGNYYIPHYCTAFVYTSLFLQILFNKENIKRFNIVISVFLIISFISGLSGIRHILYFIIPLFVTQIIYSINDTNNVSKLTLKSLLIENKNNFYVLLSFVCCIVGYLFNTFVLSKIYSFASYMNTAFTSIGDVSFSDLHSFFLRFFGYQNKVSVFTPNGAVNIFLYIFYACFLIILVKEIKNKPWTNTKYFLVFFVVLSILNTFIITKTDYEERYLSLILIYIIPVVILLFYINKNTILKYLMLFCFAVSLLTSTYVTLETVICTKDENDKSGVTRFLINNKYNYGYATFWNANVFTYLTNDKIKIANLKSQKDEDENEIKSLSNTFECEYWLTPSSYYNDDFALNEPVILITSQKEYEKTPNANLFKNGTLIYKDKYYLIYEYENNATFKNSF